MVMLKKQQKLEMVQWMQYSNALKLYILMMLTYSLYQVHAVTEGTDAQATVSVKIEENGKTTVGQAADTDTLVASANAYINALNKMIIKRDKTAPMEQERSESKRNINGII